MNHHWINMLARFKARYGDKFVPPSTNPNLTHYFGTGVRVEITTTYPSGDPFVRQGTIGITTGWQPALLLLHTRNASGSWDTLKDTDVVTAVINKRGQRCPL